jgi:VWFA-related protein
MKKLFCFFALILGISGAVFGQSANPTPPPGEDVVKISTNLIQIDVTVTDKNGKTVPGLNPEDFEVYENGERQNISNFSFVSGTAAGATVSGEETSAGGQPARGPVAPLTRMQVRRTLAVVVDDLNMSFGSVFYTRVALRKFVNEQMQPNDLVAIIRTGGGVGALQQFTSDKRVLLAAIEKIRWNPLGGAGVDPLLSTGQDAEDITDRFKTESDLVAAGFGNDTSGRISGRKRPNLTTDKARDYNGTKNATDQEDANFAQAALSTVRYIIGGMNELPGRKALMYFSDGIRINSDSNKSGADRVYRYMRELIDYANRSSVVVYTFDTRGMQDGTIKASDNTYEIIDGHRQQKAAERMVEFKAKQDGLAMFADQTGGKALLNSNDLNYGIQRAVEEQTGYYLLAYQPDTDTFDPNTRRFNKLEVKVKRSGLKASYRSGFFSSPGNEPGAPGVVSTEQRMAKALTSPFASTEISLNMNAMFADDPADGPYVRSFVHIDAAKLKFATDAEGWKKATFDIAAVTFGDNGLPVEKQETKYTIKSKGPTYDAMLRNGFVYVLIMPVKQPGVYQYRVALRDTETGKIGSASQVVEVPDLTKRKLTISSLAVEDVSLATWKNITDGKIGSNPGQMQLASTLLYDTVLKQFPAGTVLRYGLEVYNAKLDGSQMPQLETQTRIVQNNKAVVEGNVMKFNAGGQADVRHLRISGNMMLKDTLPAGDYALQVTVRDLNSKQATTQIFPFEIVK